MSVPFIGMLMFVLVVLREGRLPDHTSPLLDVSTNGTSIITIARLAGRMSPCMQLVNTLVTVPSMSYPYTRIKSVKDHSQP